MSKQILFDHTQYRSHTCIYNVMQSKRKVKSMVTAQMRRNLAGLGHSAARSSLQSLRSS